MLLICDSECLLCLQRCVRFLLYWSRVLRWVGLWRGSLATTALITILRC